MSAAASSTPGKVKTRRRGLVEWLAGWEDGAIMRFAFFGLLIGTVAVLYVDYHELTAGEGAGLSMPSRPILPPASTDGPADGAMPRITTSPELLEQSLQIALGSGGALHLTGTFDIGSADRFTAEIAARGEYVETVVLDSPGGSVFDALAIGRLIKERELTTQVEAGSLCASSCPIVFASGAERIASANAAIGLHQMYAAAISAEPLEALRVAGTAMADAQTTTGQIIAHLTEAGVDPALWLHALETPPNRLYYLSPEEMTALRLVTELLQD